MEETKDNAVGGKSTNENGGDKGSHGFLSFLIVVFIIGACVFGVVKYFQYWQSKSIVDGSGSTQSNTDGNNHLLKRSATRNDIVVDSDTNLASMGAKYKVIPQIDIENLQITVNYLDENKRILVSKVKNLGNVTKGEKIEFTISIVDISLSDAWNTRYESIAVTGGTVSYFA